MNGVDQCGQFNMNENGEGIAIMRSVIAEEQRVVGAVISAFDEDLTNTFERVQILASVASDAAQRAEADIQHLLSDLEVAEAEMQALAMLGEDDDVSPEDVSPEDDDEDGCAHIFSGSAPLSKDPLCDIIGLQGLSSLRAYSDKTAQDFFLPASSRKSCVSLEESMAFVDLSPMDQIDNCETVVVPPTGIEVIQYQSLLVVRGVGVGGEGILELPSYFFINFFFCFFFFYSNKARAEARAATQLGLELRLATSPRGPACLEAALEASARRRLAEQMAALEKEFRQGTGPRSGSGSLGPPSPPSHGGPSSLVHEPPQGARMPLQGLRSSKVRSPLFHLPPN